MQRRKTTPRFVLCVRVQDDCDLTPRKVYQVLPDKEANAEGLLRIIDDSGEDYLCAADLFVPIKLPSVVKRHFSRTTETVLSAA